MQVDVTYDQNHCHRLTVTKDGAVRIKIAKGTADDLAEGIVEDLTAAAEYGHKLREGTLRGRVNSTDDHINLYTNKRKSHFTYWF